MKAILWDNDGVLVDTEPCYFEASRVALLRLDVEFDESSYVECLRQGTSCFELARARGASESAIAAARAARDAHYAELISGGIVLIPGVREALESLHGRVPMAVVTSSQPHHFELQHARTGARRFFELVVTRADYANTKPDPEPYLVAAARLGIAPADCLAVEDTERGLVSATRAGMRCAAIPRWLSARGDFRAAWRVLRNATEVPELFAHW
ncbi:MAG TPA: HAD family phosphatase [Myxococcota bacterium]|nr:HAD family phosphatase [Myxococcota bacterium]